MRVGKSVNRPTKTQPKPRAAKVAATIQVEPTPTGDLVTVIEASEPRPGEKLPPRSSEPLVVYGRAITGKVSLSIILTRHEAQWRQHKEPWAQGHSKRWLTDPVGVAVRAYIRAVERSEAIDYLHAPQMVNTLKSFRRLLDYSHSLDSGLTNSLLCDLLEAIVVGSSD
jgi:hypothetical protein